MTIRYSQHVKATEMKTCLKKVQALLDHLKPGFLLLTDLSNLQSMDAACAQELGALMDLCCARGMSTVMRVIPDREKDIGFNLISRFHLSRQVKIRTFENLAEAIHSLMAEPQAAPKPSLAAHPPSNRDALNPRIPGSI